MPVLSEIATLAEAMQGTSLARFGHGELAILNGKSARLQKYDPRLAEELRSVLRSSGCLVAVPHTRGKRGWEWRAFLETYGKEIDPNHWYGSAFVSRPDEIELPDGYNDMTASLLRRGSWLRGSGGADDYDRIDELERVAMTVTNAPILLSCGPTATVLADRLNRRGFWAVDVGNMGAL
jgi:hypothetical protein